MAFWLPAMYLPVCLDSYTNDFTDECTSRTEFPRSQDTICCVFKKYNTVDIVLFLLTPLETTGIIFFSPITGKVMGFLN